MIYFDNAATSFPKPDMVYDGIMDVMKNYGANPGRSGHKLALKLGREIYNTRDLIANLFNIDNPMNIIFTFNCTESLNIGIKGILKEGDHVVTSSMEHNSVLRPIKALEQEGVENTIVQADKFGKVSVEDIEKSIKANTKLIVITHISNLTGTIQPIKEIGALAKAKGIYYMVDAAQSAGVYPIDVKEMNIDLLAVPGHKCLFGPQGTGALYIGEDIEVRGLMQGGTGSTSHELTQPNIRPDKYESGTPNGPGIVGLGKGIEFINTTGMDKIRRYEEELTQHFLDEIKKIDGVIAYGPLNSKEQASVVPINIRNEDSSEISFILDDEYDIQVRPGLHCAPLAHKTIGTFEQGVVRFSFGYFNTHEEIEKSIEALKKIAR